MPHKQFFTGRTESGFCTFAHKYTLPDLLPPYAMYGQVAKHMHNPDSLAAFGLRIPSRAVTHPWQRRSAGGCAPGRRAPPAGPGTGPETFPPSCLSSPPPGAARSCPCRPWHPSWRLHVGQQLRLSHRQERPQASRQGKLCSAYRIPHIQCRAFQYMSLLPRDHLPWHCLLHRACSRDAPACSRASMASLRWPSRAKRRGVLPSLSVASGHPRER